MKLSIDKWQDFKLKDLFKIVYGVNLEYSNCEETTKDDPEAIPFVSRTETNNGVSGYVKPIAGIEPQEAGLITVAAGGSVLSTFVQPQQFYSGRDLYLLISRFDMSLKAKLFIVTLITANKYKYNYGRQANKTLANIVIKLPVNESGNPNWLFIENFMRGLHTSPITTSNKSSRKPFETKRRSMKLDTRNWKNYTVGDIFDILNGKGITRDEIEEHPGNFEAIQSGAENNAVIGKIDKEYCLAKGYTVTEEPCLTVARSGTSGFVSLHGYGCVVGDSAKILLLKDKSHLNIMVLAFLQTLLMANQFKYNYGRKVTEELYRETVLKLPTDKYGKPDWESIENFMGGIAHKSYYHFQQVCSQVFGDEKME